jgi:hypothetical protein
MLTVLGLWFAGWLDDRRTKRDARHAALRHIAVVAHAVYTGSTSAYTLTPDLPRQDNSTDIQWN